MKKLIKISVLALICVIVLPFTLFLTGCGATPANEALGVFFDSSTYDEETGYAVFEVDKNIETKLDYKVNPSSWSGYAVTYSIEECSAQNRARFTFEEGVINVESDRFEEIKIVIHINERTDTCIVKLKEYPVNVFMYDINKSAEVKTLDVVINSYGSYTIAPYGRFLDANGNTYVKPLIEYDYNFVVTSSDETVVSVPHKNRLKICSIRKNIGSAKITVLVNNTKGDTLFKLDLNVEVVLNANSSVAELDGYGKLVSEGDTIEIEADSLKTDEKGNYIINYQMFVFSEDERFIESKNVDFECTVSNSKEVDVENENSRLLVEPVQTQEISFYVSFWTNLIMNDGTVYSMSFKVVFKY